MKSSRSSSLRPSPPSSMKFSFDKPPVVKPTKGELLARVETLSQRCQSKKWKPKDSLEKGHPAWGKAPRLKTSSSLPFAHVRVQGPALLPLTEVSRAPSSQPQSASAANAKDSSGRADEPPLAVMPITVWSPSSQSAEPPPSRVEELGRKHPEADGDGDSFLFNAKLAAGAISSVLRNSDFKRSGALPFEEALALFLQGVASVSSRVFLCLPLSWF